MHRNTLLGLFGVLGIWLTAGLALPFVNVLDKLTVYQLMVFRGFLTAIVAWLIVAFSGNKNFMRVDKITFLIALVLPFATLSLFQGIRYWGAGPTIIVITATPLVNFAIGLLFFGRKVSRAPIIGLVMVLGGVVMARLGGHFNWAGFGWSVLGTILNGILYELFARTTAHSLSKCFWGCFGMGLVGMISSGVAGDSLPDTMDMTMTWQIVGFAFVGGFLYWLANLIAFSNLPTNEASVLAQGETPAVIIGAWFLLNENTTTVQWIGVAIALLGALFLSNWLAEKPAQTQTA